MNGTHQDMLSQIDLLSQEYWQEPLQNFARSIGLSISLYNTRLKRTIGPFTPTPLAQFLLQAGAWNENSACCADEIALAKQALKEGRVVFGQTLGVLSIAAVPIIEAQKSIGACVMGWCFDHFIDPVENDRMARMLGVPATALWQIIRQHNPISKEKTETYCELLKTLIHPLLLDMKNRQIERRTAKILKILNFAAQELTASVELNGIIGATRRAVVDLTGTENVYILLVDEQENMEKGMSDDAVAIRMPIEGIDGVPLGVIEVGKEVLDESGVGQELSALASQVAVAMQKVRLISDLRKQQTSLQKALEELKRLNLVRDEFLCTLSHELKTPLNSMLGWCQMLRMGILNQEEVEMALETIERNAKAQAQLVDELLDSSRIVSGKMNLNLTSVDLDQLAILAIETIKPAVERKNIKLEVDVPRNLDSLKADRMRLQQVLWNLLSNAVKFTPVNGRIGLKITQTERDVVIEVSDTGAGIKPDFLPHIFDRFTQADSSMTRRHGGLGLGLAIVKQLVELHGGCVEAQSDGEWKGSRFIIHIPRDVIPTAKKSVADSIPLHSSGHASPASDGGSKRSRSRALTGLRVLVVDDDRDSRVLLKRFIEAHGACVHAFELTSDALQDIQAWHPDLILSDISMPIEDGYSFMRRVRALPPETGGRTPAIAVTAYTKEQDKAKALAAGFQAHLGKPFDSKQFIRLVASLVGQTQPNEKSPDLKKSAPAHDQEEF